MNKLFQDIHVDMSGTTIKQLAANKLGRLLATKERNLEQISSSIDKSIIPQNHKTSLKDDLQSTNLKIDQVVIFLETMKKYLNDGQTYTLTMRELYFLENADEIEL